MCMQFRRILLSIYGTSMYHNRIVSTQLQQLQIKFLFILLSAPNFSVSYSAARIAILLQKTTNYSKMLKLITGCHVFSNLISFMRGKNNLSIISFTTMMDRNLLCEIFGFFTNFILQKPSDYNNTIFAENDFKIQKAAIALANFHIAHEWINDIQKYNSCKIDSNLTLL